MQPRTRLDAASCKRSLMREGPASIEVVFDEIIENILGLMMDPFGNYLIQKMLDRCSEEQRLAVLKAASTNGGLISASLNTHGTRAVQKPRRDAVDAGADGARGRIAVPPVWSSSSVT